MSADPLPASASAPLDARAVLAALPDCVVVVGPDGRVTFVNDRAARLLRRPAQDVVGLSACDAIPLEDDAGACWWEQAGEGEDERPVETPPRERLLTLPGAGHVLVSVAPIPSTGSGPPAVAVLLRVPMDGQRLETGTAELLSIVAHELRSPLSSVRTFSDTLLRRWERFTDGQRKLMVETIASDSQRLFRLLNELLDVSRLDSSRLRMSPRPLDVRAVISSHVSRLVRAGHDRERFDWWEADRGRLEVWADADRLDQILANLAENALMHGEGRVTVTTEEPALDAYGVSVVAISVADQGSGIDPALRPKIFEKFWHGTERGSTGLGLYLVKGLVEAHGGHITVGDAPGGGALFRFTIPTVPPPDLR